jgi:hypothetical protein
MKQLKYVGNSSNHFFFVGLANIYRQELLLEKSVIYIERTLTSRNKPAISSFTG